MTADNDNTVQSQGLYIWQMDNLLAATASLDGHWQLPQNHADTEPPTLASKRIATDTRTIKSGDIFLALSGDNFDGHDYIDMAASQGAIAAIVSRPITSPNSIPQLVVSDTRLALGQLAAFRRQQHKDLTVIAITGSSGKTTCKEMLGSIFGRLAPTLITRGNLNNDLGVPMMLLELSDHHRYAILELGANHIGEIAYTTEIVRPDVACILNIGTAHLGEFGSREGICQTKAEIYSILTNDQFAIVPDKDDFTNQLRRIAEKHTSHVIGFGNTDVSASHLDVEPERSEFKLHIGSQIHDINLPLAGEHNVNNALAAAACAHALNIAVSDIVIGLENARPAKGRLNSQILGMHRLIDDTYNANPHSVRAAAKVLAAQTGTQIMVLGDIGELGEAAVSEHQSLGRTIATTGINVLLCVGEYANYTVAGAQEISDISAHAFADKESLLQYLQPYLQAQQAKPCTVLFKGSRSMGMETLIHALVEE
ncbi:MULTISPECIES: UDP-N-acetylmuramoyl-tripeptide--D-alanyl-D-alanine ligase [unclassified Psychrobacter]|uniref:UDP-N-acetylmuramoyl-tripeptide--D-alanyl-D- alanine ligase n=1 Tax=unclassified Psychrobacter TaxID=196806 RepID=UPI0025B388F8|nr:MULTISPECIES: UDP-N-acetylmuramoyl-tripeptide--D-alanyl-D-alanine ligase [unclassified Psychrobacter]MDN3453358.1 UDP-N-acetylmuramoyl-tripeptide--D-alanyl-D-alanine ligase [Psychrobacter sp. APC 3350]MDN3501832.1 UDP-N-acetylmuramoyl-tripeptide--D-alanyl-D-alanine ligase [Psychrobacter sp. 5A.1]